MIVPPWFGPGGLSGQRLTGALRCNCTPCLIARFANKKGPVGETGPELVKNGFSA